MSEESEFFHRLTEEEKIKVQIQVDYFLYLIGKRYNTNPNEVLAAINWVKERRELAQKIKSSTIVTTLGILASALALAIWEGLKIMVFRK